MFKIIKSIFKTNLDNKPMPPCGDKKEHYEWEAEGISCPHCLIIQVSKRAKEHQKKIDERKRKEQEELATNIANKVIQQINHIDYNDYHI